MALEHVYNFGFGRGWYVHNTGLTSTLCDFMRMTVMHVWTWRGLYDGCDCSNYDKNDDSHGNTDCELAFLVPVRGCFGLVQFEGQYGVQINERLTGFSLL